MNPPETQAQTPRTETFMESLAAFSGDFSQFLELVEIHSAKLETELSIAQDALAEHEKLRDERLPWEEKLSEMWKNPEWVGKTWAEIAVLQLSAATAENARLKEALESKRPPPPTESSRKDGWSFDTDFLNSISHEVAETGWTCYPEVVEQVVTALISRGIMLPALNPAHEG